MKTKLSLLTLFACAAGTTLFADYENYDGRDLTGQDFFFASLSNSSWIKSTLADVRLSNATLINANFTGANLTNANLRYATLTGSIFDNAIINGADFGDVKGFTTTQLYSTLSYKTKDLSGIYFGENELSGWDFSGQCLVDASLSGATVTGANFTNSDLTNTRLSRATLTGANFTNAIINGSFLDSTIGFTATQLYSTASYKSKDLSRVCLSDNEMSGWNFSGQNLSGANLDGAMLVGADFVNANLTNAWFCGGNYATLTDANFTNANLTNAYLRDAELGGANFTDAEIVGADLSSTIGFTATQLYSTASYKSKDLSGVRLSDNKMSGWNFSGQNLSGASLVGAMLVGADFVNANLTNAYMRGVRAGEAKFVEADLTGADFYEANLLGVDFTSANLSSVTLTGANLTSAHLRGAKLGGANFTDAEIVGADLDSAVANGFTATQLYSTASYKSKDLSRVCLSDNEMSGWNFSGQNLSGANLDGAMLVGADFVNANLTNAWFCGGNYATLTDANFTNANLTNAYLRDAKLGGANFTDAEIVGADLGSTVINGFTAGQLYSTASYKSKNLSGIGLSNNDLSGWNLTGQNLLEADFANANLSFASLAEVDLTSANLGYATLTGSNLEGANLKGTTLVGVNFTDAEIVRADLGSTVINGFTAGQLYSTASYKSKNLSGIGLSNNDLSEWNLAGQNLLEADFVNANLSFASLAEVDLTSANLGYATLRGADFTGATLTGFVCVYGVSAEDAIFTDADLSDAHFYEPSYPFYSSSFSSNLSGAKFIRASLTRANLRYATLTDANFTDADLTDAGLRYATLRGANFTRANLRYATLTDADFTDSVITGANFDSSDLMLSQLYSTKSYKDKNLSGVLLNCLNLSEGDFKGQNLTSADLSFATLTNADFTGATLTNVLIAAVSAQNVNFTDSDLSDANFCSFHHNPTHFSDLSGAKFIRAKLTSADLSFATLTNADFTGATLTNVLIAAVSAQNVNFTDSDLSNANFYDFDHKSTHFSDLSGAKFIRANLTRADLRYATFTNANFTNANLTNAYLRDAELGGANFTGADLRGASYEEIYLDDAEIKNTILTDGDISGFSMTSTEDNFVVRKYTPKVEGGESISAKIQEDATISGGAVLSVAEGGALDISTITLAFGIDNEDETISSISVAESGSVTLASGAKIVIDYAGRFNENTRFAVMNWTDSSSIVGLNSLTKGGTLSLFVDGAVYDDTLWDFSTENNALTIFGVATSVAPDPDLPDPDEPIIPDPDVPVIPEEPDRVVISSASQSVDLTETDSSADFDGSLTVFSGTVSGAGSLNSAGTLTFSGDASTHTGTTNITSGTFTVSGSAKLGTGDFDISGTLAISGSRTFSNATRGTGTLRIASGTTTFTNDVGVKTFAVSQGASATLSAGVDLTRADAEAQVAGTLNLLGTRTFSAKTSGNGKISLASGSDVSFAKAVGVKTLAVENGATLRGSVSMTHGADAKISLAGTLVLNPDKGEKVSLGGGRVEIASSAKLDLVGSNSPFVRATSAQIEALENGERVTIFEGGAVSGNVLAFLRTDADLSAYAQNYAVIYDESNGGLSVRVVKNASVLMDGTDTSELSASFVDWALSDANDALNSLSTGFVSAAAWNNLSGGNDPLLNAILAKDAGTARAILDRLSPKSYAAMIAMPVEAFNADARSIFARLEQRRYDRFSKRAQWEFFAQLQTNSVENDTATDAPTFDFDTTGLLAGADYKLDQNTVLGVALGASTGEAKVHNGGGKIESTDFRVTGFAGKTIENYFVNAGAQLGYASYDIKRNTDYGNASGDTTGWSAGLFADAGTVVILSEAKKIYATPYIGLAYMHTQADAFTESGIDKAFDADAISGDSLRARVGCGFSWGFSASGAVWRLGLDVAFSHDFLGDEVDVDVTTQDGSSITETAKALPEDMFSIGPSFNVDVSSSASVYGGYSFNAGTDASVNHSANVGFRMRF